MKNLLKTNLLLFILIAILIPAILISCDDDEDSLRFKQLQLQEMSGSFVSPVGLVEPPDETNRLFVVDQVGKIYIIDAGNMVADPFLDISGKMVSLNPDYDERGLLGLAFHPNYKTNGKFYIYYSAPLKLGAPIDWNHTSVISEFTVSNDANKANMSSDRIVLEVNQPQSNHNGGTLAFGPDGFLYISIGDGGNKNDIGTGHVEDWYNENEGGNGQDVTQNLLGNILRIDVNGGSPYNIPSDNPFADGSAGMKEIYAFGLRNPYRFSFDPQTGMLIAGDAGQALREEIDVIIKGGNYGWNVKEGTLCFNAADNKQPLENCPDEDPMGNKFIDPVIEFKNMEAPSGGLGLVVVGGNVYRGNAIPSLQGKYLFANFSSEHKTPAGDVFMATPGTGMWLFEKMDFENVQGKGIGYFIKGFGQANKGEIYILGSKQMGPSGSTGKVLKIVEE